jgi:hypothetical protein
MVKNLGHFGLHSRFTIQMFKLIFFFKHFQRNVIVQQPGNFKKSNGFEKNIFSFKRTLNI